MGLDAPAVDSDLQDSLTNLPASEAIPFLLAAWGNQIYRLGLAQCGTHQDAEDLVQETFLLAFRHWHQFEGRAKPSTWLFTIAARACRRRRRRRSGEPARLESLSELLPAADGPVVDLPSPEAGPLDDQLRREARQAVERGIAELPSSFRLPLVLKDIAELRISEIAAILGLKPATVKTRAHRARLLLRKRLAEALPSRAAPAPDHARSVCLDLLRGKQEAMDRGVTAPLLEQELCSRCSALFSTLDLAREVCHEIGDGEMPAELRALIERRIEEHA